ncbi:MAG: MBL fold metallo-hydrolase [Proteiniphilum sp.]
MQLVTLGSSSRGNSYVIQSAREALVLEAGIDFQEVQRALDWNVSKVAACLITHEHQDHSARVNDFLNARIPVYASEGTIEGMNIQSGVKPITCEQGQPFTAGRFQVIPFRTKHDCREPLGFYIRHPEMGTLLFATDTYYLPFTFDGLNNIMIECNYSRAILDANIEAGKLPKLVRNRVVQSHMSLDNCIRTLTANDLTKVNNIVLIHLSDGNANPSDFQRRVTLATGKTVHIAQPGKRIQLKPTPF